MTYVVRVILVCSTNLAHSVQLELSVPRVADTYNRDKPHRWLY